MSRLINPGLGDQLDRLTILSLKILHKGSQDHWVRERAAILTQVQSRVPSGAWLERLVELGAVNAALWQAEDDLRMYRGTEHAQHLATAGKVGLRIQELNDRRSALVDAINGLVGEDRGAEKG